MRRYTVAFMVLCCAALLLSLTAMAEEWGVVTASALALRDGPGLSYEMLGEIPNGARLEILLYRDGWYHVRYGEQYGYVSARYVRLDLPVGAEAAAVPAPTARPMAEITPPPGYSALPALIFDGENNPDYPRVLKPGDMGNAVADLQVALQNLGYSVTVDGQYGYDTQAEVMKLQRALGIDADGIVGSKTRRLIGNNNVGGVELLDWWLGGNVAYARLTEATVMDVRTGRRFQISRYGGENHCDAEPMTSEDTAIFLSIAGGDWTWDRRPVWIVVNGRVIAASMNCMPQEGEHILDNNFSGHFCIHFYNSRTSETDRIDEGHAACVQEAWESRGSFTP